MAQNQHTLRDFVQEGLFVFFQNVSGTTLNTLAAWRRRSLDGANGSRDQTEGVACGLFVIPAI